MASRVYLTTSGGEQIVTLAAGEKVYVRDLLDRRGDLAQIFTARAPRRLDLAQFFKTMLVYAQRLDAVARFNAQARHGYTLWARNAATGVETSLGFIAADASPLQLAGVARCRRDVPRIAKQDVLRGQVLLLLDALTQQLVGKRRPVGRGGLGVIRLEHLADCLLGFGNSRLVGYGRFVGGLVFGLRTWNAYEEQRDADKRRQS